MSRIMRCGHPFSARAIEPYAEGKRLRTYCWACRCQEQERDGERLVARARARDNRVVGVSDVSATMRDGAASGAYSTRGRVAAFTGSKTVGDA